MSPKQRLISSSALFGFVAGLGSLVFLVRFFGSEDWDLIFLMPFEASLLFPIGSSVSAAIVATRFDPLKFRWLQGIELACYSFFWFSIGRGISIAAYWLISGIPLWLAVTSIFVVLFSDVLFGLVFVGWIVLPAGALLGFLNGLRSNKSLNTDASDAGAG
jgi:hypothetical protein